jgi:hypothetical protein
VCGGECAVVVGTEGQALKECVCRTADEWTADDERHDMSDARAKRGR